MDFISFNFYIFLSIIIILYYIIPVKYRWYVLLIGSTLFYFKAVQYNKLTLCIFFLIIFSSYIGALFISKTRTAKDRYLRKIVLGCTILVILLPFFMVKAQVFVTVISFVFKRNSRYVIIPLGISFFTMQMIAYLVDVYYGKITAQKNFFKYSLFISFFPQINSTRHKPPHGPL